MRLHLSILSACLAWWVASGPAAAQPASSPPDPGSVDAKDRAGKSDRDRDAKARPKIGIDKPRRQPSVGSDAPGGAENALPSMGATPGTPSGSFGGSTPGRVKDPK
jgi:hypothetical protein